MKATVTSKGQITIHLKATKCADVARMHGVIGIAKEELAGRTVDEWIDELRGPVSLLPPDATAVITAIDTSVLIAITKDAAARRGTGPRRTRCRSSRG